MSYYFCYIGLSVSVFLWLLLSVLSDDLWYNKDKGNNCQLHLLSSLFISMIFRCLQWFPKVLWSIVWELLVQTIYGSLQDGYLQIGVNVSLNKQAQKNGISRAEEEQTSPQTEVSNRKCYICSPEEDVVWQKHLKLVAQQQTCTFHISCSFMPMLVYSPLWSVNWP